MRQGTDDVVIDHTLPIHPRTRLLKGKSPPAPGSDKFQLPCARQISLGFPGITSARHASVTTVVLYFVCLYLPFCLLFSPDFLFLPVINLLPRIFFHILFGVFLGEEQGCRCALQKTDQAGRLHLPGRTPFAVSTREA
jgi:hypothetical protein